MTDSGIPDGVAVETIYIVEVSYTADAPTKRPAVRPEHLSRVARLITEGRLIEAGGFQDFSSALFLVPAADEAAAAALEKAEAELGFALPPVLRRVYLEVADGGFGPGGGLMSIAGATTAYAMLRKGDVLPRGRSWPERLLPIREVDPGFDSVDAASPAGRIVAWDPEELREFSGEKAWNASFSEIAPSVEAWLEEWVGANTQAENDQEFMRKMMIDEARRSRAYFAAMTPEERAAYGFPEVGWESQIADGLGMEEDEADRDPSRD